MNTSPHSILYQRITRLRWQVAGLAFLLVLIHQTVEHTLLSHLPHWEHFMTQVLFYGVVGPLMAWWALSSIRHSVGETEVAQHALKEAHAELSDANQRLEFLLRVNRRLADAEDEVALIDVMLALPFEVVPALGCSLIRFDERNRPLPAIHRGTLDSATFEAWVGHLSATETRQACEHCSALCATDSAPCPVFISTPDAMGVRKVHCLTLVRGGREYGMLHIYLQNIDRPNEREQMLLDTMADEMSLALESHRLRSRELSMLYRLQRARRLSNLKSELSEVLTHTVEALEIDGGVLFQTNAESGELYPYIEVGHSLGTDLDLVRGLTSGARQTLTIGDLKQEGRADTGLRSLLAAPLCIEERMVGSLVLWATHPDAHARRHVKLVTAVATQMALLIENQRLYGQVEHQAALAERARLAREIHDGLAQTLGYLKLRAAQISTWLKGREIERVVSAVEELRGLLAEAYVDAREAIDGLRLKSGDTNLREWLDVVLTDFQDLSAIEVDASEPPELSLAPEVQAQLQRIVQEALSNIRKHSHASCARLNWQLDDSWLTLRIADDGLGFDAEDVPPVARHGLRIMRERAELLDADFQIVSRRGAGTEVVIRLPLNETLQELRND